MSEKSRFLLMFTLFLGLSFGLFFSSTANAYAFPELSPDGKTCTPCHEEGFHDDGGTEAPAETPGETPAEQPAEPPAAQLGEQAEAPEAAHKTMSPWLVVGGVIVILGVIYFLVIKKKQP